LPDECRVLHKAFFGGAGFALGEALRIIHLLLRLPVLLDWGIVRPAYLSGIPDAKCLQRAGFALAFDENENENEFEQL
jgi:hypothetical protein